jgi:hypothetical protein
MVQHDLRDRAEGHALEATPATGAHHEHLGFGRGDQQRRARRARRQVPDHRDFRVPLGLDGHQVIEVLFHLLPFAQPCRRVGEGAHRYQGHVTQRGLFEGEGDRGLRRRRSVRAYHHRAGGLIGRPPLAADDHDPPGGVPGYLPGNRSELQAGQLAVPAAADHDHVGRPATFAQRMSGRPAGQLRVHPAGAQHRLGVRQPPGQDFLAVLPGQIADRRLGGQRHVIWRPGEADGQPGIACLGFPGGPA